MKRMILYWGSGRSSAPFWLLGFLVLGVVLPSALQAQRTREVFDNDFLKPYKAGLEAIERSDWAEGERLMRQALAGRDKEARRIAQVGYFRPYVPHYYLGLALYQQGDCAGALAMWQESASQGVLSRLDDEMKLVRDGRQSCRQQEERGRRRGQLRRQMQEHDEAVASHLASIDELARNEALARSWEQGNPSPARRSAQIREENRELSAATADLAIVATVGDIVKHERLEQRWRELREAAGSLRAELTRLAETTAAQAPQDPPGQTSSRSSGQRSSGSRASDSAAPEIAAPPQELVDIADLYLQGRYQEVLAALKALPFTADKTRAHAFLLRAAARHALARRSGAVEERTLERIQDDLEALRSLAPDLRPSPVAFPPSFVAIFDQLFGED